MGLILWFWRCPTPRIDAADDGLAATVNAKTQPFARSLFRARSRSTTFPPQAAQHAPRVQEAHFQQSVTCRR